MIHPRYDGRAGPRDQTLYFFVRIPPAPDGGYDLALEGRVQETVELLSKGKGREVPFMKMEEEGLVYRAVRP